MSPFSDLLRDNIDTSCILLCGYCTDQIIPQDLCLREFSVALSDILRENGFDNVVFFDCTNAMGKYVYDDQSARFSMQGAWVPNAAAGKPAAVAGMPRFGVPRKAVKEPDPTSNPSKELSPSIQYQQKNLMEPVFYGECQAMMNETTYRSAVVFTNINNLLKIDGSMSRYAEVIHNHWRRNNLLIFLHPDLTIRECAEFYSRLKECGLLEYFYTPGKCAGEYIPRPGRVFRIRSFGRDEIRNLLLRHRIFHGLSFPDGLEVAAEKLHYVVQNLNAERKRTEISVRLLNKRIDGYLSAHPGAVLNDEFLESILDCNMGDFDFHPWDTLRNRHGWESVVQSLSELFAGMKEHPEDVSYPASLLVERIGGDETNHSLPSSKLPHLILEGSPGTGKTTIVRQLGRIMHDEGILSVGHVVLAYRSDLIADVIGGTAIKVQRLLDRAENGILFIDEAYDLCKDYDSRGNAGTFAMEAVTTLVNAMTDDSRHVMIVFAGYRCSAPGAVDGVQGLFRMNPGLESRIKKILSIPDYEPETLTAIFFDILREHGLSLADDLSREDILTYMENIYQSRNRRTFGNGRFVRENLIERKLLPAAARRGSCQIARCDFGEDVARLNRTTVESVRQELAGYPVLGELGERIIADCLNHREMFREEGKLTGESNGLPHLIISADPGTGKRTLVRLLCKALAAANIINVTQPVEIANPERISSDELEKKIRDAVDFNTILFVHDAHNCPEESLRALASAMANNQQLTCIFAVYQDRYAEFLGKERSLNRLCRTYAIDDYTPPQLMQIFHAMAEKEDRVCSGTCEKQLEILFQNWYDNRNVRPGYGNASDVESLLHEMKEHCYVRTKASGSVKDDRRLMTEMDIPPEHLDVIDAQGHKKDISEILEEMNRYIGWTELKEWLTTTWKRIQYKKDHPNHTIDRGHMRFTGSPGTGKTTAGKLFADACYAMGLITTNHFVQCTAKDLIAGYVGQTQEKTAQLLESGRNGVIFIDEAYGLAYREDDFSGDSFKKEAVEYLLAFAERELDSTIVIVAGYEQLIDRFIDSNVGLASRFPFTIHFPNFTPKECTDILARELRKEAPIADDALEKVIWYFAQYCAEDNFANGRDVRNIRGQINNSHINRLMALNDPAVPDMFTVDDIVEGFEHWAYNNGR